MKAIWNDTIIAESEQTEIVEGNHYFPKESVNSKYLKASATQTTCPWKGQASYFSIEVNGKINKDAAWYYPSPSEAVSQIKNRVAFWKGVEIRK